MQRPRGQLRVEVRILRWVSFPSPLVLSYTPSDLGVRAETMFKRSGSSTLFAQRHGRSSHPLDYRRWVDSHMKPYVWTERLHRVLRRVGWSFNVENA